MIDQPITSLGDGPSDDEDDEEEDQDEDEEVWDPAEEKLPWQENAPGKKDKGKGKAKQEAAAAGGSGGGVAAADGAHPWQAVWSPDKNGELSRRYIGPSQRHQLKYIAWYFWNTSTGEVTWTNPLAPAASSSSSSASSSTAAPPLPAGPAPSIIQPSRIGGIPDIDPDLAYLLPSVSRYIPGSEPGDLQSANFSSRSGRFNANNNDYAIDRLDEYNREKRFNSKYFDQDKWEAEMRERNMKRSLEVANGGKPAISKKDMVCLSYSWVLVVCSGYWSRQLGRVRSATTCGTVSKRPIGSE